MVHLSGFWCFGLGSGRGGGRGGGDGSRRRGLGLFIAREAAEHNGGALVIDTEIVNREGRYTTFDYRVIGSDE